ncbi:MAG TPA: amidohydrolase family protein [Oceanipulchritudo sp.]|nr:amidohydrolase family protein [Oceanipulchritudo sp.]
MHCYPSEVIVDPAGWARRNKEPHWENLVTNGPQGWADPEELLRCMDRDGVDTVLLQAWYWENSDTALHQNEWHAGWLARYPGRFLACASVHPDMADPVAELEAARQWGACAVGECLPQIQTARGWSHPAWETILHWTTQAAWPFCLHVTEPVGHSYPGRVETPMMELLDLFEQYPEQRWLLAHWGGGLPFHFLNRRVRKALDNVWFDSAASPLLYRPEIWRIVHDLVGPSRMLFGSDFPLLLYPSKEQHPGWQRLLAEVASSGLGEDALAALLRDNFSVLFR